MSSSVLGPCEEKTRLRLEYRKAAEVYFAAVNQFERELSQQIGINERSKFLRLKEGVQKVRQLTSDARDRLKPHVAQHGC